ncbi:right-handed parallel beta-helix repeat-containing protein [Tahibacter caeni]|uniref:right-handed parallel beta-helix repeat-containing protein n=1 Tax=Tahibacter caeni TaxID=1453545 RepID=UPI0021477A0D|nr:right-handed parallel beta-helix repeat-containing protein [Tahibacter caeni]
MRTRFLLPALLALVFAALPLQPVWAISYCVGTISDLKAKLAEASTNGFSDEVKIRSGFYQPTAAQCDALACFEVHVTDGEMLRISGGWDATCQTQSAYPQDTIFEGSNLYRLFFVEWQHANIDDNTRSGFRNIELRNGLATFGSSGGCASFSNNSGDLTIDRNVFTGCAVYNGSGGGFAASARQLFVRNNLVVDNVARYGAGVYLDVTRSTLLGSKSSYVSNNTFADNLSTLGADGTGGLQLLSSTASVSQVYLTNNIIHGNDAGTNRVDLDIDTARIYSANNLQGTQRGTPGPGSTNGANSALNPRFVGGNSYALAPESPARNRGLDSPPGGALAQDLSGGARVFGSHIDIGAYEAHDDVIFAADFQ